MEWNKRGGSEEGQTEQIFRLGRYKLDYFREKLRSSSCSILSSFGKHLGPI